VTGMTVDEPLLWIDGQPVTELDLDAAVFSACRQPARPLFHFTCRHSFERMVQDAVAKGLERLSVVPNPADHLVWCTDLRLPARRMRGLTRERIACDRMEYRLEVAGVAHRWTDWAHEHRIDLDVRLGLDGTPGARPRHWWVSPHPMAVYDVQRMPIAVIP
jgi:hypothetical protein